MSAKNFKGMKKTRQESIAVGCVPPACQPYMFWWLPLGVSTSGWVGILGEGILGRGYVSQVWYPLPRIPTSPGIPPLGYLPPQDTYPTGYLQSLVYLPPGIPTNEDISPPPLWNTYPPPTPIPMDSMTDARENITFPQLLLRVVITSSLCSKSILFYNIEWEKTKWLLRYEKLFEENFFNATFTFQNVP